MVLAGLAGTRWAAAAARENAGNAPVVLGLIGCGRRGSQLIEAAARAGGIVVTAVCDVNAKKSGAAAEQVAQRFGSRPVQTSDYRDILDDPAVEGVVIATPDHWHTIPFLAACAAGKHIYIEAPLCKFMAEAKAMVYAARKYHRVVQVGLQHRSSSTFSEAGGIVRSGRLGRIAQTRSWTFDRMRPIARQPDGKEPEYLDYDRWLGPASEKSYNPVRVEYPEHFWDYGHGQTGRWDVHLHDLCTSAMNVAAPTSVTAVGGNYGLDDFRETPDTLDALFEYESPTGRFMHVYSLRLSNAYASWGPAALPPVGGAAGSLPPRSGVQFFGSDRTLFVRGQRLLLLPAEAASPIDDLRYLGIGSETAGGPASQPAPVDPLTIAHVKGFAESVRSLEEPAAGIESGMWSLFPCVAANVAYRLGRKLYIKPESVEFFRDPQFEKPDTEANELMFQPCRPAYPIPNV